MAKKKETKKEKENNKLLVIIFVIMTIILITLSIITIILYNKKKEKESQLTIPLISKNINTVMSLDISNIKANDKKEYYFNISNHGNRQTTKKEISYTITVYNEYNLNIQLYKNGKKIELKNNKNILNKEEKQTDKYRLVVLGNKSISKDSKLKVQINS